MKPEDDSPQPSLNDNYTPNQSPAPQAPMPQPIPQQPAPPTNPTIIRPTTTPLNQSTPTSATSGSINYPAPSAQPIQPTQQPINNPNLPNSSIDASQLFKSDSLKPDWNGQKKRINKKGLIGIASFGLALIIGLGWLFGMYLPNKPENVWRTGLGRTGSTLDKLVVTSTGKDKLEAFKSTELSGSLEVKGAGVNFKGSFASKYDLKNSDSGLDLQYSGEGANTKLNAKFLTEIPDGTDLPNIYFQFSGLKSLGLDLFLPQVSSYDGKWISVSSDYLKSVIPAESQASFKKDQEQRLDANDVAELARITSGAIKEYVFTSDTKKTILDQDSYIGTEKLENNVTAYHYQVSFNKQNTKEFCKALTDRIMSSAAYKKLPGIDTNNIEKDKNKAKEDCDKDVENELKNSQPFDMWVDKKYKLIHKFRFTDSKKKGDYVEVGQTFQGQDNNLPLFAKFHSDESKYDGTLKLEVNTNENLTKGSVNFSQASGNDAYSLAANFEIKPYQGEIKINKPDGAIPVQKLLRDLGMDPTQKTSPKQSLIF